MKVFFRNIHLYLSLVAGLIIMMSCLTGAIMVFEHEIDHTINQKRYMIKPAGIRLPLSTLAQNALAAIPKSKISSIKVYADVSRTVEIGLITPEKKEDNKTKPEQRHKEEQRKENAEKSSSPSADKKVKKGGDKPNLIAFLNPYTGKVVEVFNRKKSFFFTVEMMHRWLLAGNDSIGKKLVGYSASFFLFILITGLILWWPKTKAILRQRLKIKVNAGWKRLNHDLHIVTGFYVSLFMIIIVMTGLIMSFNWINKGIFTLTGTSIERPEPPNSVYQNQIKPVSIDAIYTKVSQQVSNVEFYNFRMPKDSVGVFSVSVLPHHVLESAIDTYYLDQFTGSIIGSTKAADKNLGQKIRSYVKPVHTGEVFGLPTKILSLILCLLTFTFPITGVIMWLNRLKTERNKKQKINQNAVSV